MEGFTKFQHFWPNDCFLGAYSRAANFISLEWIHLFKIFSLKNRMWSRYYQARQIYRNFSASFKRCVRRVLHSILFGKINRTKLYILQFLSEFCSNWRKLKRNQLQWVKRVNFDERGNRLAYKRGWKIKWNNFSEALFQIHGKSLIWSELPYKKRALLFSRHWPKL